MTTTCMKARVPVCVEKMVKAFTAVSNAYETGHHDIVERLADEAEFEIRRAAATLLFRVETMTQAEPVHLRAVETEDGIVWEPIEDGAVQDVIDEISMRIDSLTIAA
jgi:hypothetical protein